MNRAPIRRILYVEDDHFIQVVARMALEEVGGFALEVASSGPEGLVKAREFAPDLILLDAMMPGMTGMETLVELKKDLKTRAIPIIFMTAKVQPNEVSGYLKLGAVSVIPKPFDPTTLSDEIRAIWEKIDMDPKRRAETGQEVNETILLVDDDPGIRRMIGQVLRQKGYSVLEAESAAEAEQIVDARSGEVDILLTDCVLPGISGSELARRLSLRYRTLKVLYMSGYLDPLVLKDDGVEPGELFLSKPFTMETLLKKVGQVLDTAA